MSVLGSLVRQVLGRKSDPARVSTQSARPIGDAITHVVSLAKHDSAWNASRALIDRIEATATRTPADALRLVKGAVLPVLAACEVQGDALSACDLDVVVYKHLVRRFELPSHYEQCLALMDGPLRRLGATLRHGPLRPLATGTTVKRVLFFFQFLGSAGAHVDLFTSVMATYFAHRPEEASLFGVTGVTEGKAAEALQSLQASHGIAIHALRMVSPRDAYASAIDLMTEEGYDRLVIVAMPIGLSFLSGALPAGRLGWWSMKFELGCFDGLTHRCALMSAHLREKIVNGKRWLEAPPMMEFTQRLVPNSVLPDLLFRALDGAKFVFCTINREEKIRHPGFLEMVARVLKEVPRSRFLWTGRFKAPEVVRFFESRGLGARHFYIGWIHPDDLLAHADVFLDTPVLSGTVAARAAVLGKAVVTLADSQSWMSVFLPAFAHDRLSGRAGEVERLVSAIERLGLRLEAGNADEYVATAIRLANDPAALRAYGEAIASFANRYFLPNAESVGRHVENLRAEVEAY